MDVLRRMKLIVDTESMVNSFVQYLSLWVSLVAQIVKNLPVMQEIEPGLNLWVEKIPGKGNGCPFYYSCLENSMDRVTW